MFMTCKWCSMPGESPLCLFYTTFGKVHGIMGKRGNLLKQSRLTLIPGWLQGQNSSLKGSSSGACSQNVGSNAHHLMWFHGCAPGILEQSALSILLQAQGERGAPEREILGLLCIAAMFLYCYLSNIQNIFAGIGMVPFPKSHKNFLHSCFLLCILWRILAVGEQIWVVNFSNDCFSP